MYRIIIDSSGELTEEMRNSGVFVNVPLTLTVGEENILDDETFDQASFLQKVAACPTCPKSACPSPAAFAEKMENVDRAYVITLSAQLSGTYNSALIGADMAKEDNENLKVHVFDSKSASIGQSLIGLKIKECEDAGMSFEEVIRTVDEYIAGQHTFFVLETLDVFIKNGRISNLKAFIASALNIKPIMGSTDEGAIQQLGQSRGINRALEKMCDFLAEASTNTEEKILAISHCNCRARAEQVKEMVQKYCHFKDIIILDTRGVSSLYASDGGVIMVV